MSAKESTLSTRLAQTYNDTGFEEIMTSMLDDDSSDHGRLQFTLTAADLPATTFSVVCVTQDLG